MREKSKTKIYWVRIVFAILFSDIWFNTICNIYDWIAVADEQHKKTDDKRKQTQNKHYLFITTDPVLRFPIVNVEWIYVV